jgi:isoquinoline 1-oxidoreductase alpha subunit
VPTITLSVNGRSQAVDVDPDMPLLWVLRDTLGLVGTKFGCGGGFCGACTVHVGGAATRSCTLRVGKVGDRPIVTIEGLAGAGTHPVQRAWTELDVAQCGYCQAGQIMTAAALLVRTPRPTDDEIAAAMNGNICRCGTYMRIREAVRLAGSMATSSAGDCAQVVELSVEPAASGSSGSPRRVTVHSVTCALDCGIVVNRSGLEAQAQGGIIDGLGHAFFGEITIDRGRAVEGNFDRYRLIRNREAPRAIDIHVVSSTMRPTGFGEIAVPVIAPAVANAIAALTGDRLRQTPLVRAGYTLG